MLHWLKDKSGSPKRGKQAHGDLMWHPYRHAMIFLILIFDFLSDSNTFFFPASEDMSNIREASSKKRNIILR